MEGAELLLVICQVSKEIELCTKMRKKRAEDSRCLQCSSQTLIQEEKYLAILSFTQLSGVLASSVGRSQHV